MTSDKRKFNWMIHNYSVKVLILVDKKCLGYGALQTIVSAHSCTWQVSCVTLRAGQGSWTGVLGRVLDMGARQGVGHKGAGRVLDTRGGGRQNADFWCPLQWWSCLKVILSFQVMQWIPVEIVLSRNLQRLLEIWKQLKKEKVRNLCLFFNSCLLCSFVLILTLSNVEHLCWWKWICIMAQYWPPIVYSSQVIF